jgi:hypothetical protein
LGEDQLGRALAVAKFHYPPVCYSCSLFLNHAGDAQGVCYQQGLHFSTASHLWVRWLKALTQFSLRYQRTRHKEGVF